MNDVRYKHHYLRTELSKNDGPTTSTDKVLMIHRQSWIPTIDKKHFHYQLTVLLIKRSREEHGPLCLWLS